MSKFINKIGIIFLVLILLFTSITTINPTLAINSNSEIETSDVNVVWGF